MRILIIEDNELVAGALKRGLQKTYIVDTVGNSKAAQALIDHNIYDALLIDLQLPDGNGLDICKALRAHGFSEPIIIVTGQSSINDKVTLLDSGADDYVTKPFSLEEIKARLRAVMRRTQATTERAIERGAIEINSAARSVKRNGDTIHLRRKEFDLLEYLLRHEGKALTRSKIMSHVWDGNQSAWANVVDVHIRNLRGKLDRPYGSNLIRTVHGVGYKLETADEGVANNYKRG